MAQKPVYQVQQKVLISVDWRCCPGFQGPDCQDHSKAPQGLTPESRNYDFWAYHTMLPSADPTANPEPTEPSGKLQETWDSLDGFELGMLPFWKDRVHVLSSSFSDGLYHLWKMLPLQSAWASLWPCPLQPNSQGP